VGGVEQPAKAKANKVVRKAIRKKIMEASFGQWQTSAILAAKADLASGSAVSTWCFQKART
jgi:hypothetical protein